MTIHLDDLRAVIDAATVADGSATLPTAPGWPGWEVAHAQTFSWATLADYAEALAGLAQRAKASVPKGERQLEQEAEAAEQFASFEEDCRIWSEVCDTDTETTADLLATLADKYGVDLDSIASLEYEADRWLAFETIVSPLSVESRDDSPDCNCQHCPEGGEHGTGAGPILHRVILCTGGPHYELQWPKGEPDEAVFVSMPWFGRVELQPSDAMVELASWLEDEGDDLGVWDD